MLRIHRIRLYVVFVVALFAIAYTIQAPKQTTLFKHATKVLDLPRRLEDLNKDSTAHLYGYTPDGPICLWLSKSEVMALWYNEKDKQNRFNAVTYNLLTRRWTENIALEKALGPFVDNIYPDNWIVSPDGKRILYRTLGFPLASQPGAGAKQTYKLYVCALMGGSVIKSHTGEIKSMGWCPANNGYFIITPDDQGRGALSLYNKDGKQTQTTSIAISGYVGQAYMDTKGSLFDLMGLSLYVAHAPDYVIHDLPLNMDGNRDTNDSREVVISPNRGGFADIEHVSMRPFWSHILENGSVYYPNTRECVAISVCNTDGSAWHEVGRCPYAYAPYSLQWTPDGKRLSFIYDNVAGEGTIARVLGWRVAARAHQAVRLV